MSPFLAELFGTAILVLLGDGVVANVLLNKSKGQNSGWIVITTGWALAVTVGVYCVGSISGGHLNPAVTLALATIGKLGWDQVPVYLGAQMAGAFLGAVLVWLAYLPHWEVTEDKGAKLGIFCTAPAIRKSGANLLCEIIGTAMLLLGVLAIGAKANLNPEFGWDKGFGPALVGVLVWSIGLSPATHSTPRATWVRALPMPCCPSRARAAPTGATPGCQWSARSSAGWWAQ
jgi:glycerol uptake facilitator protein